MRRSIIRLMVALAVLAGGAAVLSRSVATSLPRAAAETGTGVRTAKPKPARPTAITAIRLARQPHPRISKALAEPTNVEFVQSPLQDVVDCLKDLHNVEIQIDSKALEEASIGPDTPVTCNLKGISLDAALDLILDQLELAYVADGDVLIITSQRSAQRNVAVRLYDCAWAKPEQLADLIEVVELVDGGGAIDAPAAQKSEADADRPAHAAPAFKVVAYGSSLVVRATEIEHETVRRLLAELRVAAESKKAAANAGNDAARPAETKP